MRFSLLLACLFAASAVGAANREPDSAQRGDIEVPVSLDAAEQSGSASRRREDSCAPRDRLVADHELRGIPAVGSGSRGLRRAGDRAGPLMAANSPRHELFVVSCRRLTYEIHATYDPPSKISIERISGDLRILRGSWVLQSDGDYTVAHYMVDSRARLLGAALDRAVGPAARSAEDAACAAHPC